MIMISVPSVISFRIVVVIGSGLWVTVVRPTLTLMVRKKSLSSRFPNGLSETLTRRWHLAFDSSMLVRKVLSVTDSLVF